MKASPQSTRDLELHAHVQSLRSLAMALVGQGEAEDLLSRVYVKAKELPSVPRANIRAWLAQSLRNAAIDWRRSETSRVKREKRYDVNREPLTPEESAMRKEALQNLRATLDELDGCARGILLMRYFDRRPISEIGSDLGVSEGATRVRLSRALATLRNRLRAKYGKGSHALCLTIIDPRLLVRVRSAALGVEGSTLSKLVSFLPILVAVVACGVIWANRPDAMDLANGFENASSPIEIVSTKPKAQYFSPSRSAVVERPTDRKLLLRNGQGKMVPRAEVLFLGPGVTMRALEDVENEGAYRLPEGLWDSASGSDLRVVISSLGHVPHIEWVSEWKGDLEVVLPTRQTIEGKISLIGVDALVQKEVRLDLTETIPDVDSEYYGWRQKLDNQQKDLLDSIMTGAGTLINGSGEFQFAGVRPNWSGALLFHMGEYEINGAEEVGVFQAVRLERPMSKLHIRARPLPKVVGSVRWSDGLDLPSDLMVLAVDFPDDGIRGKYVSFDPGTGKFSATFNELPIGGKAELLLGLGAFRGKMSIPYSPVEEMEITLPRGRRRFVGVETPGGFPLQGVILSTISGERVGVTGPEGFCEFAVPGFVSGPFSQIILSHSRFLPVTLREDELNQMVNLEEKSGIEIYLNREGSLNKGGFGGYFGGLSVEISCSEGIIGHRITKPRMRSIKKEWHGLEWSDDGRLLKASALAKSGQPISLLGFRPAGELRFIVLESDKVVLDTIIRHSNWGELQTVYLNIPRERKSQRNGRIVFPDGRPASFAKVVWEAPDGRTNWLTSDGYGSFSLADVPVGESIWACQGDYQASRVYQLAHSLENEGKVTLALRVGRKIQLSRADGPQTLKGNQIAGRVLRMEGNEVIKEFQWRSGEMEVAGCPMEEFNMEIRQPDGTMRVQIPPGESNLKVYSTVLKYIEVESENPIPLDSRKPVLQFSANGVTWTPKSFKVLSFGTNSEWLAVNVPKTFCDVPVYVMLGGDSWQSNPVKFVDEPGDRLHSMFDDVQEHGNLKGKD